MSCIRFLTRPNTCTTESAIRGHLHQMQRRKTEENLKSSRKARAHRLGDKHDRLCRQPRSFTTLARPITGNHRTSAYTGIGLTTPLSSLCTVIVLRPQILSTALRRFDDPLFDMLSPGQVTIEDNPSHFTDPVVRNTVFSRERSTNSSTMFLVKKRTRSVILRALCMSWRE
jgi:hypothetical protein